MSEKLPIGTRIRFPRELTIPACGDHPRLLLAFAGEQGTITDHNNVPHEGYMVKTDNHAAPFGASDTEFERIEA